MMHRSLRFVLLTVLLAACGDAGAPADWTAGAGYAEPGAPLPGLGEAELARFERGRELFHRPFTPDEGLGPLFNQQRCSSCHDLPVLGGFGAEPVIKATAWDAATGCDLLTDQGGDMLQTQATPLLQAAGIVNESVPERARQVARIMPPALFGAGLIEAIPDSVIALRADSADADGDGISGRVGRTSEGRIGRFGRRAEFADLREFITGAALLEMGLTTTDRPTEEGVNGRPLPPGVDPVPDPELPDSLLTLLIDYVRFLAVPARDTTAADTLRAGAVAFRDAGCDRCHTPVLMTAPNPLPQLDRQPVALYSDLLLHEMGPEIASICGPGAGPSEFRTAPLLGLRLRQPFLHDGRAQDLETAIRLHGGEAEGARRAFEGMGQGQRMALMRFLRSL